MDTLTSTYLAKVYALQRLYGERYDTFSVELHWDEYYETYIRCTYSDKHGRYMADFIQCVTEEDYERVYNGLLTDLKNGQQ